MRNFLALHFGPGSGSDPAVTAIAERVSAAFVELLAKLELQPPPDHDRLFPNDKMYQMNYQRWVRFCRARPGQPRPWRVSEIFGKTMLASVWNACSVDFVYWCLLFVEPCAFLALCGAAAISLCSLLPLCFFLSSFVLFVCL